MLQIFNLKSSYRRCIGEILSLHINYVWVLLWQELQVFEETSLIFGGQTFIIYSHKYHSNLNFSMNWTTKQQNHYRQYVTLTNKFLFSKTISKTHQPKPSQKHTNQNHLKNTPTKTISKNEFIKIVG